MRRVLCRGTKAEEHIDNSKCLIILLLIILKAAFAQM